jgi:ABC-type protease/lipase transport system fused ATPase/permease subunit
VGNAINRPAGFVPSRLISMFSNYGTGQFRLDADIEKLNRNSFCGRKNCTGYLLSEVPLFVGTVRPNLAA